MAGFVKHIIKILTLATVVPGIALGVQAQNQRSGGNNSDRTLVRSTVSDANASIRRAATSVIARSAALGTRKSKMVVTARPVVSRAAVKSSKRIDSKLVNSSRAAALSKTNVARGALIHKGIKNDTGKAGLARAGKVRATAVFNDVSKIGGGYANCRDAYATCMDQFCANANDTYRRCFCSDRFMDFRDTSDKLDEALGMLADFQNNNLNAVDKTAAEVNAMYSSTAGEAAIKEDTSASQKMLDEIGDVLAGKKKRSSSQTSSPASLGIIDLNSFSDMGDIWSGSGTFNSSSIFDTRAADAMTDLEGKALYQRAASQCAKLMTESCTGDAMFSLASSAYSVMVTQDCNLLEKSINAKKENIMQTVRQAESILREARLDEYRAHNSQDVNDCLTRVEEAMTAPTACGEKYVKCLDYTGLYINATTGEPIPRELNKLTTISPVLGGNDIIAENPQWDTFLESYKNRVTAVLDTCRSLADDVWKEFKRTAMIRIAQAQADKIEDYKSSCVATIKECYNRTDDTLADLTNDAIKDKKYDMAAGRAVTVRDMCYQDVLACASMYGDADGCEFNRTTMKITPREGANCGLESLLAYVDTVDSARVAKGCETAVLAKAKELCTPEQTYSDEDDASGAPTGYPDGCKDTPKKTLRDSLLHHADEFCALDAVKNSTMNSQIVDDILNDIFNQLGIKDGS